MIVASERSPDAYPALVLNADFRPLSYFPLSLWSWQDTIKAVFMDRVNIVEEYDRENWATGGELSIDRRQQAAGKAVLPDLEAIFRKPAKAPPRKAPTKSQSRR